MIYGGTIESVADTLLKGGPAALALLALLLAFLIRYRTNSGHAIFRWLWRLMSGRAESNDIEFNEYMEGQDNLMQFRFLGGKARTVAQMHSLINWGRRNNEGMLDVNACGPYFDRELPGLMPPSKRPTRLAILGFFTVLFCAVFLSIIFTVFASLPAALITIKETKLTLLLDMQSARSVLQPSLHRLGRDQCQQTVEKRADISSFSAHDVVVICEIYADPDAPAYIARTVRQQLGLFGVFAAMLFVFSLIICTKLIAGNAALAMAERLGRTLP